MLDANQEPPPPKPVRPGRRIIRSGVGVGVLGFVVTAVGAFMLGQGPGPLEIPGGAIHRIGMVGMLGGFLIVLLGYRWPQIRSLLTTFSDMATSEAPSLRRPDLHRLLDEVGPDLAATVAETVPVEVVTPEAATSPTMRSPEPDVRPRGAPLESRASPPVKVAPNRRAQVGAGSVTLLIIGWTLIGLGTFFGLALYFLASRGVALLMAGLAELALVTALLVIVVYARGALRTFAIGALVPVVLMAFMCVILLAPVVLYGPGMGGIWGPYGVPGPWQAGLEDLLMRAVQLVLQLLLMGGGGTFALFIRLTLMLFERRLRPVDSPATNTDAP